MTWVYLDVDLTEWIGETGQFFIFVVAAFLLLSILVLVHIGMTMIRRHMNLSQWKILQNVCYIVFMIAEFWVIAFVLS